jgi:hypothetical protein
MIPKNFRPGTKHLVKFTINHISFAVPATPIISAIWPFCHSQHAAETAGAFRAPPMEWF